MRSSKRRVIFNTTKRKNDKPSSTSSTRSKPKPPVTESAEAAEAIAPDQMESSGIADEGIPSFDIPYHFTRPAVPHDDLVTPTSKLQDDTVAKCLPFLLGIQDPTKNPFDFNEFGVPRLEKIDHIDFLIDGLGDYPAPFVAADASRPWMIYWSLNGLTLLGEDVSRYRKDVIKTFTPAQSPTGGFGGGHGQLPHLAGSYAAMLSIALVGGTEVYEMVDREAMWRWLGRLKQPDGSFRICEGGEMDTRGAYSAMVLITLLNLPMTLPEDCAARKIGGLKTFTDGLPEWISRSQTYEGGIGGSPGNEAHGAYTFLGIACLCLIGSPHIILPKYLDLDRLISWLTKVQNAPEGGFSGRLNKLVDGCYSHWIGGCFPLVQAALQGPLKEEEAKTVKPMDLYSREGLVRYTLSCCQQKFGGLRDKPGKRADGYHTCYTLSALSQTQHFSYYTTTEANTASSVSSPHHTLSWAAIPIRTLLSNSSTTPNSSPRVVWDETDEVGPLHPLFVIQHDAAIQIREWAEKVSKTDNWI